MNEQFYEGQLFYVYSAINGFCLIMQIFIIIKYYSKKKRGEDEISLM